jgi:hypothetical protein
LNIKRSGCIRKHHWLTVLCSLSINLNSMNKTWYMASCINEYSPFYQFRILQKYIIERSISVGLRLSTGCLKTCLFIIWWILLSASCVEFSNRKVAPYFKHHAMKSYGWREMKFHIFSMLPYYLYIKVFLALASQDKYS